MNICSTSQETKMQTTFGPKTSVTSVVMGYLFPPDITRLRQVSRHAKTSSEHVCGPWKSYVQSLYNVYDCPRCNALRNPRYTEHCPLCEKNVCVDHLVRCSKCCQVYCDACVGFCC